MSDETRSCPNTAALLNNRYCGGSQNAFCAFSKRNTSFVRGGGGIRQEVQGVFNIQPSGATDSASQCPLIPPSNLLHTHPASLHILYHGYPKPGVIIFTTPFQIFSKEMCWHIYDQIL